MNVDYPWFATLLACALAQTSFAQASAPRPESANVEPKSATLKFIEDALNALGATQFVAHTHDDISGDEGISRFTETLSNAVADPLTCILRVHEKEVKDDHVLAEFDAHIPLQQIADVVVMPAEEFIRESNIQHGQASIRTQISPTVFVLKIVKADGRYNDMKFTDRTLANRMAEAMTSAAKLCHVATSPSG